jgi:Zn-dependent protease with chaperone function
MAIVAPIAAMLIQFAISRQREFKADEVGAMISGRPLVQKVWSAAQCAGMLYVTGLAGLGG